MGAAAHHSVASKKSSDPAAIEKEKQANLHSAHSMLRSAREELQAARALQKGERHGASVAAARKDEATSLAEQAKALKDRTKTDMQRVSRLRKNMAQLRKKGEHMKKLFEKTTVPVDAAQRQESANRREFRHAAMAMAKEELIAQRVSSKHPKLKAEVVSRLKKLKAKMDDSRGKMRAVNIRLRHLVDLQEKKTLELSHYRHYFRRASRVSAHATAMAQHSEHLASRASADGAKAKRMESRAEHAAELSQHMLAHVKSLKAEALKTETAAKPLLANVRSESQEMTAAASSFPKSDKTGDAIKQLEAAPAPWAVYDSPVVES